MIKKESFRKKYLNRKLPWGKVFYFFSLFFLIIVLFSLSLFVYHARDLPRPERFTERPFVEPTRIYDRTGKIVLHTIYGEEERSIVSLDKIPPHLIAAVTSIEDANFFNHFGIDFRGMVRATIENIRRGRIVQGGSTISQQLITSTFFTRERSIGRKIREIILTLELERRYSKDQIMEFYLNQIPFGGNIYGVESAAQAFFNESVSDLTLPESAVLAALIRSPSRLSPYGPNRGELLNRKDHVINRMAFLGHITNEEATVYKKEEITFSPIAHLLRAPHFTLKVIDYLNQKYGEEYLRTGGLKIYTTLDWGLQQKAEEIIRERIKINRQFRAHNLSLIALNPNNGQILAMVGSANYFGESYPKGCQPGQNCLFEPYPNVTLRLRQPGSAFKPFVYASAFKNGHNDQTMVVDEPINIGGYSPRNYDGLFRGPMTLRSALAQSLNIPAVRILNDLTNIEDVLDLVSSFGITSLNKPPLFYGLSLALGAAEVSLLEITSAYGVFATEGLFIPPNPILKITDLNQRIIEKSYISPQRVLNSSIARIINDILSDNEARTPIFGSNSQLNIPNVSVKTGTTDGFRDGWAIGYNESLSVGVWAGNNNNRSMNASGLSVAAPVWREFFDYAIK